MSDEDFLRRWSRRKREARAAETPAAEEAEPVAKAEPAAQEAVADEAAKAQVAFDEASLPPIGSITAASDISPFLRAGVPPELTRAALRRVWTADPTIRDFVGLSESAWDFTDPNSIPGFGALELTEEVRTMITRAVEQIGTALEPQPSDAAADKAKANDFSALKSDPETAEVQALLNDDVSLPNEQQSLQSNAKSAVLQHGVGRGDQDQKQLSRRRHGGALPRA